MELPEYRFPSVRNVGLCVEEKAGEYLAKAGTTIFLSSVFLWFLLHTGPSGFVSDISCSLAAAAGRLLTPVLSLAGLGNWKTAAALLCGLSAKEAIVSGFSVLYGIKNLNSEAGMAQLHTALSASGFGPVNAYALMIFCLLYTPLFSSYVSSPGRDRRREMDCLYGGMPDVVCFSGSCYRIPDRTPSLFRLAVTGKTTVNG